MADLQSKLRILMVVSDDDDRLTLARLVRSAIEADVEASTDCVSALAALRDRRFDCVLLDDRSPDADGTSLLRDLRSAGGVPVIVLVAVPDEHGAAAVMKAGAADYLYKATLTADQIGRSLRYAVALHRGREERQRLLEREQQARLDAQTANRAKDEFLATLSHELRTPLNAILGWAQLLAGGQLDRRTASRAVEIIERNTRLQAQVIDDLLDISRIITGKLRLERRAVSMRSIVEAAVESALGAAGAKHVMLEGTFDGASDAIVCDPARMQQVIWNLLTNAIKFTPEGGHITISEERRDGRIILTVVDTGVGIEPEFLPHVFDRFRQQDAASTRRHGGLGLGLYIVRHIVEMHGGSIEALSEGRGLGATFVVTLPLASALAADDDDADDVGPNDRGQGLQPAEVMSLAGVRVLVVDNEADARGLVSAILESRGADVTAVESTAEALQEIEANRPDVLLSDIAMPGEEGYALIKRVRQLSDPGLPAAALTAYGSASDRAQALRAGYQAHVAKPIQPAALAAVVASLAGRIWTG